MMHNTTMICCTISAQILENRARDLCNSTDYEDGTETNERSSE